MKAPPINNWQEEESELIDTGEKRPSFLPYITVVGPLIELRHIMGHLVETRERNEFNLPSFEQLPSLGYNCLIINLNDYQMYLTEVGLTVGEWRKYYLPFQYAELVKELIQEGKRVNPKQS